MGLIRNQNAAALLRDAVVLDLGDIASQADAIRRRAREDAERTVAEARRVADRILQNKQEEGFKNGYEKGYADGLAKGAEAGRSQAAAEMTEQIEQALGGWIEALNAFCACRENLQLEAKQDVLCLALQIAERVVYRAIEIDSSVVEDQLAETLGLLAERTAVVIHVHPDDLETSRQIMPTLLERLDYCADATVLADDSVTRGGCYVRAGKGDIDARIETQLTRIVEALLPGISDSDADAVQAEEIAKVDSEIVSPPAEESEPDATDRDNAEGSEEMP